MFRESWPRGSKMYNYLISYTNTIIKKVIIQLLVLVTSTGGIPTPIAVTLRKMSVKKKVGVNCF